ncbi:MAG: hypothetical protein RR772_03780, partial [Gordonibacter sp.]
MSAGEQEETNEQGCSAPERPTGSTPGKPAVTAGSDAISLPAVTAGKSAAALANDRAAAPFGPL